MFCADQLLFPWVWLIYPVILSWSKLISFSQHASIPNRLLVWDGTLPLPPLLSAENLSGLNLSRYYACCNSLSESICINPGVSRRCSFFGSIDDLWLLLYLLLLHLDPWILRVGIKEISFSIDCFKVSYCL